MESQTGQTFPPEWVRDQGAPDWRGAAGSPLAAGTALSRIQAVFIYISLLHKILDKLLSWGGENISKSPNQPLNLAVRTMPQHPDMHTARQAFPTLSQCLLSPVRALVAQWSCRDVAQSTRLPGGREVHYLQMALVDDWLCVMHSSSIA